ncbi:MAG TPA: methyltransferase domain-containing protein [Solirubrobacteraceae bacterium]|nr:methyltransferase domain-containing protein [Solirubrobacteraceae bacterium]
MPDALAALRASLAERLAALREVDISTLPTSLLDVIVRTADPGGLHVVRPADWEALREDEAVAGRAVPWWARLWPSGLALARALHAAPPPPGARVLELGCGLGLPALVAAQAGARVLATDGNTDAVVFAAHGFALNELAGDAAHADWAQHGELLTARGPFDVVLAADVFYTQANVPVALRLLPALLAPGGAVRLADPGRAGARDFLAGARGRFRLRTSSDGDVALHELRLM